MIAQLLITIFLVTDTNTAKLQLFLCNFLTSKIHHNANNDSNYYKHHTSNYKCNFICLCLI